jgi:hypothetical protein
MLRRRIGALRSLAHREVICAARRRAQRVTYKVCMPHSGVDRSDTDKRAQTEMDGSLRPPRVTAASERTRH